MLASILILTALMFTQTSPRDHISLDEGWKFTLGNAADPKRDYGYKGYLWAKAGDGPGPSRVNYPDGGWRSVNVPHDWAVELPFVQGADVGHGSKPVGRQYPDTSIGWYRRKFAIPKSDEGRHLELTFDGVSRDSRVWVNGHSMAHHDSGYTPFTVNITDVANYGGENVVCVRVDATQFEGWWYEGAGIYRHVGLDEANAVHVPRLGLNVSSSIEGQSAVLKTELKIANDSGKNVACDVTFEVVDPKGKTVARMSQTNAHVPARSEARVAPTLSLALPTLWSLENPALYTLRTMISANGTAIDQQETRFGIRSIRFDKDHGFFLNDKPVKIKGMCNHQDHAGVGIAVPDAIQRYRLKKLKEMGVNAYRCSHNPPTPELLDACDELGILVMDETRMLGSSDDALDQLRTMVKRDRNHPSVILWSIGNEEGVQGSDLGRRVAQTMAATIKELDDTRPVTYACNGGNVFKGINEAVDVRGFNYFALSDIDKYHQEHPDQPLFGSEEASTVSTRDEYANERAKGYVSAYDVNKPGWGSLAEEWMKFYMSRDYLAGAFVWTGFDYRGEPTPYGWPCISSHFGIIDTCGFPKDLFYYYQAWWTDQPVIHILPHWNWKGKEGQPIDVWVFSNASSVNLKLNGRDLGSKEMPKWGHVEWRVPYQPGKLEAIGHWPGGKSDWSTTVETTGEPTKLVLIPDRKSISSDGKDCAVVAVSALDEEGRLVPLASNDVTFEISGEGTILGVGNGDPSCHEPDRYFSTPLTRALEGWKTAPTDGFGSGAPNTSALQGRPVGVQGEARGMPSNSYAIYWTTFDLTADDIAHGMTKLEIGQVDDEGRVYVNGALVGSTDDWDRSYEFDVAKALKAGRNEVAIVVRNGDGIGGIGRGMNLSGASQPAAWHRSLFHGLASAIVQSGHQPGKIRLTARATGLQPATIDITSN